MTSKNDNAKPSDDAYDDKDIADLLMHSFETSIKTTMHMIKLPVVCYVSMLDSWSRAMDSAMKDWDPGNRGE